MFGTTAFETIDEALAVAAKGDTLIVSDGRYTIDISKYYDLVPTIIIKGVSPEVVWWCCRCGKKKECAVEGWRIAMRC